MLHTHEKYVFGRSPKESERLDKQHDLLTKITENNLIHPSIPRESILSVADIATGTGIWLKDVARELEKSTSAQRYYHGFDISPDQFPTDSGHVQFSVHDITKPFPKEHWNRYDLVHVRLLVAAIDESDYQAAIANIHSILKPGGYLQWEEIDEETYISNNNPVIWEIRRCFDSSLKAEGKCFRASAKVRDECIASGFWDVIRLAYSSEDDSSLRLDTEKRLAAIIETLYASLLLRSGQVADEDAASMQAQRLIEEHRRFCQEGNSPPLRLMRVVGQKPLRGSRL
ncbi:uncharacterized protein N7496_006509 [Penicillium cataractarum]|uniref:Methyltransferase domain-containing protein n=1 Tax=Penicillium cataractarum TaxID=2100454 RepID=A0A9W9S1M5_9EURO|nr:uncharacterized protein N7496_006509 [Penicillium cataractarum]KAJ5370417.1 hypothetical protein N7496_006509 [Penicillium cataractarum]